MNVVSLMSLLTSLGFNSEFSDSSESIDFNSECSGCIDFNRLQ